MQQIFNSLSGKAEPFVPMIPGQVRMYVCGMTVYDYCHLGHARAMVVFDMVSRYFRHQGYQVTYVRNITDIDDKIIQRANERGESIESLTGRFIKAMQEDAAALGVLPPDYEPRAMQYIDRMIALIQQMVVMDVAYVGRNGDVYARPGQFAEYGKLSKKRLEDLRTGDRIEVDEAKESPYDFVLWKKAREGEPRWNSPWGDGRPSWHVECCAMSTDLLGESFDIHGGGVDLQFPHHENEIMISESAHQKHYANYWMHNGHVKVQSAASGEFEKMAKSLGNFFTIRDLLKFWRAEEIRLFLLTSHYRSPLNYSPESLSQARQVLTRYYLALRDIQPLPPRETGAAWRDAFHAAMKSDFNTPKALSVLADLVSHQNRLIQTSPEGASNEEARMLAGLLKELGGVLGLLESDPEVFFLSIPAGDSTHGLSDDEISALVEQRQAARAAKDWAEADRIRQLLQEANIQIEDKAGTSAWRRT